MRSRELSLGLATTAWTWPCRAFADATSDLVSATALDPAVQTAVIWTNAVVRLSAIAAGTLIVWLGHDTMVRGIKGDFTFNGKLGKLKGSMPGLLFVLLGSTVVGWALAAKVTVRNAVEAATTSPQAPEPQGKGSAGLRGSTLSPEESP